MSPSPVNQAGSGERSASGSAPVASGSPTSSSVLPPDLVVVGRVVGSYGVQGWLKIEPFNDPQESVLLRTHHWYLQRPASLRPGQVAPGRPSADLTLVLPAEVSVENCRVHGATIIASVAGVAIKEAADSLRGCELGVRRIDFPETDADEFYWIDLIGCSVITPAGLALGLVDSVDHYGAHPLLRLRTGQGAEILIPFVAAHVLEVDLAARRIVADWDPEF